MSKMEIEEIETWNPPVTTDEYQDFVAGKWQPSELPIKNELRASLGIFGEGGEVAELIKKWHRPNNPLTPEQFRERFTDEMGDLLFYIAALCSFYDVTLDEVLKGNILKLEVRALKGTILTMDREETVN